MSPGAARFGAHAGTRVRAYADLRDGVEPLADGGWWAVVAEYDGPWHAWRMDRVPGARLAAAEAHRWPVVADARWGSSMSRAEYVGAVATIRDRIRDGEVYQANLCRVLSAPWPEPAPAAALAGVLAAGNPAPYAGWIDVPARAGHPGCWLVSASPELGLAVGRGVARSGPIKGTATTPAGLTAKDEAENVMITDLVRNDLGRLGRPGTVRTERLLDVEEHPGLAHLVSEVSVELRPEADPARDPGAWAAVLEAVAPAASISGAPKSAAVRLIDELEPVRRGPYCGLVGWIDADSGAAGLAVGIRTFWHEGGALRFGTGAGITWGSDPEGEWAETELKAARLVGLAGGSRG